jgi:hypothetical protein
VFEDGSEKHADLSGLPDNISKIRHAFFLYHTGVGARLVGLPEIQLYDFRVFQAYAISACCGQRFGMAMFHQCEFDVPEVPVKSVGFNRDLLE